MKLKKFFCAMLTLMMLVSCFMETATAKEIDQGEKNFQVVVMRASGSFSTDVPANTSVKAGSSFPLEVGEVVTIKATYSPFSASVDFGLIAPDGLFYGLNTKTGSFDKSIEVNQRGYYTLAIRNNSGEAIEVSGFVRY